MFAPPHRGLALRPRALRRRPGRPRRRRDARRRPRTPPSWCAVDYEPLPSVTATADAAEPGRPAVWDECPDNVSNLYRGRRRGGHRRRLRARPPRRPAPLRDHAACTPSTWSRAAPSASTTRARIATRSTPTCSTRTACATRSRRNIFKIPEHQHPRHRGRRRRRLRHQGLAVRRAPPRAVGRPQARPAGQLGLRAPRRRSRPTSTPATTSPRPSWRSTRDGRFLALRVRTLANVGAYVSSDRNLLADLQQRRHPGRRLRHSRPPTSRSAGVLTNTNPTAPVPRRRAPRGDLRHRAAHRRRGPRARARIRLELRRREPDPGRRHAVQDRARRSPTTAASSRSRWTRR